MSKRVIALFILVGGVIAAFSIAHFSSQTPQGAKTLSIRSASRDDPSFAFKKTSVEGVPSFGTPFGLENNITETIVQRYGEEVLKLNSPGSKTGVVVLPPEGTMESIIAESLQGPFVIPDAYSDRDLRIGVGGGKEAAIAYFTAFEAAYEKSFRTPDEVFLRAAARMIEEGDTRPLSKHIERITKLIGELLAIEVPSTWKMFHVSILNTLTKRKVIAQSIMNIEGDPLKAATALQSLQSLSEEEDRMALLAIKQLQERP